MASKADKHAPGRPATGTHSQAAAAPEPAGPSQVSVLLVQTEALHEDELIRAELRKQGFKVKHQALVHLTKDDARHFIDEVSDPSSTLHAIVSSEPDDASQIPASDSGAEPISPRIPAAIGDGESLEDAVRALASGPVLMLAVEKPNAVADLLELVGSANPELWSHSPAHCLRARFGKSREELGVRCSLQESTVALEIEFLLACSGPQRESRAHHLLPHDRRGTARSSKKSTSVDLEQLLDFLFPAHLQHPNSAGRLFVFGLYGPLDAKARLRSGEKGLHIVTDQELTTMSKRMEREDILSVYRMCSLSQDEEELVLAQVDQMTKSFPQYAPRDIQALFRGVALEESTGHLSFHAMQQAILKERCRRVLCMKEQLHPALAPPIQNKYRHTLKRLMKSKDEIAPASFFLKDSGFTGAENATLVSRLLSNHSFEICHLDDGNSSELTQNVRLLREQIRPIGETREPWNPNCQKQQQHRK